MIRVNRLRRCRVGLVVLIGLWPAAAALAVPRSWIGGTGTWSTPGLWSPAGVPGAGDEVSISPTDSVARTVTYNYTGPAVNLTWLLVDLNVGGVGTTTLAMPGNNLSVTDQYVGYNGSGTFTQTGGTADVANTLWVGMNFGSTGAVNVHGATTSLAVDWLSLGNHGEGMLTIENDGFVSVQNKTSIGDQLNGVGTAVVTGAGSTLNYIGWMDVGSSGHGMLTIADQGLATGGGVYLGGGASGFGELFVDGAGSLLDAGYIAVGSLGQGELMISNSGDATSESGIIIADVASSVGDATVSGNGSELHAAWYFVVGHHGYGKLLVENGGVAEADNGFVIGVQADGTGDAIVTGASSRLEGEWYVIAGEYGEGKLTVESGGLVTSPGWIYVGRYSGSSGTLHVGPGGTARTDQQVQIADAAGSTGDVLVSGGGARLESGWWFGVGVGGHGTLTVESGATAEASNGISIGDVAGGRGEATVRGAGSTMLANWGITAGKAGRGSLTVRDGASASALNALEIGYEASGVGDVTVTGANSSVTTVWHVNVGASGQGTLTVEEGGTVTTPSDINVAANADSQGVVHINGGTVTAGVATYIGGWWQQAGGQGVLNVNSGGTLNVPNFLKVYNAPGNILNLRGGTINTNALSTDGNPALFNWTGGTLHLTSGVTFDPFSVPPTGGVFGAARTISGTRKLKVTGIEGLGGTGGFSLTVTNGGVHEVTDALVINANGALHLHSGGTVIADQVNHTNGGTFDFTGGTLHVNNFYGDLTNAGGTVAPGNSIGTTAVSGDYTQSAGTLQIEIASATSYDLLDLNGAHQVFGGTLQVLLLGGYMPAEGASFNILDWNHTSEGSFSLSLPDLSGSLAWNTTQLYTNGVISVAASGFSGDSNDDGFVNTADYVAWRKLDAANGTAYGVWRENFGEPASGGAPAAVPEPCSIGLAIWAASTLLSGWRIRQFVVV